MFAEVVKYACWLLGVVGLIIAYLIYATPMHIPFVFTLALAFVSMLLLFGGLIIYASQGQRSR